MRQPPLWLRVLFVLAPFFALFLFPWPLTLGLSFLAGLIFPPIALIVGILTDVLYHPGSGWPIGTSWGLILALIAYVVRHVMKTRIM